MKQLRGRLGRPLVATLCAAMIVVLAACSFERRADNPVERRLTYFSYLSGADIRRNCWAGSAERYRIIYNAQFPEHLRVYEVTGLHDAPGGVLDAEVFSPRHDPTLSIRLPLWPWQGQRAVTPLSGDDMTAIRAALKLSGAFARPAAGLKLDSASFYWAVTGCVEGHFFYNGFAWPSDEFAGLAFPDILARYDRTGVPVVAPQPGTEPLHSNLDRPAKAQNEPEDATRFFVTIGRRGVSVGSR